MNNTVTGERLAIPGGERVEQSECPECLGGPV